MKDRIKLCLLFFLLGMFIFSPLVAFAQEKGEVTQGKMTGQSVEDTTEPFSEGDKVDVENPSDPTSSPLSEEYKHKCSPHEPHKGHRPH